MVSEMWPLSLLQETGLFVKRAESPSPRSSYVIADTPPAQSQLLQVPSWARAERRSQAWRSFLKSFQPAGGGCCAVLWNLDREWGQQKKGPAECVALLMTE